VCKHCGAAGLHTVPAAQQRMQGPCHEPSGPLQHQDAKIQQCCYSSSCFFFPLAYPLLKTVLTDSPSGAYWLTCTCKTQQGLLSFCKEGQGERLDIHGEVLMVRVAVWWILLPEGSCRAERAHTGVPYLQCSSHA